MALRRSLLLVAAAGGAAAQKRFDVVGWYVGDPGGQASIHQPEQLDWDVYTIIRHGGPKVAPDGTARCDTSDTFTAKLTAMAHAKGAKLQWGAALDVDVALSNATVRANYLASIGQAVADCSVDGIEFDYEAPTGVVTPRHATEFTQLMADIKKAMGPGKLMSEDVGVWGLTQGSYPLLVEPWVNVTMLNRGDIDFVNTMSYHMPREGGIEPWKRDGEWFDKHGFDRSRVNIGLPYYTFNMSGGKIFNEPTWGTLGDLCPDIAPDASVCEGIPFCGKAQNEAIGAWVREQGFRGVFPWAANYDNAAPNNSLIAWLGKGLQQPPRGS